MLKLFHVSCSGVKLKMFKTLAKIDLPYFIASFGFKLSFAHSALFRAFKFKKCMENYCLLKNMSYCQSVSIFFVFIY